MLFRNAGRVAALAAAIAVAGCERGAVAPPASPAPSRPNIVWVVWDTVRVDRLSVYGCERPTTPRLAEWAAGARVFTDVVSPGSTTVPSHASMFTGLLPSQHRADNEHPQLDQRFETVAEILSEAGYATYLFSANPFISHAQQFAQGFSVAEHPWSPRYVAEAERITREKIDPADETGELAAKVRAGGGRLNDWNIKTAGRLAQDGVLSFLEQQPKDKPFFVFVNYMEAHRPLIPPRRYRELMMTPEQVARSYKVDRSWVSTWAYTFGLKEFSAEDIEVTRRTYDAAIRELDDLFADLLDGLRAAGRLENTIVILTSDHGEHLGEHHLLDHQFSLYEELLRVPLIIHYPGVVAPGREARPVSTIDLFPTLLGWAHVPAERIPRNAGVGLMTPLDTRSRIAEYPAPASDAISRVRQAIPSFDPTPWMRSLRAVYDQPHKLIAASDERHELYDLAADPAESNNLLPAEMARAAALGEVLRDLLARHAADGEREATRPMDEATERELRTFGYVGSASEDEGEEDPAAAEESQPTTAPASHPASQPADPD